MRPNEPGDVLGPRQADGCGVRAMMDRLSTEWPLVGRAEERSYVWAELEDPDSCGLLLSGPPGVGKSRLLHAVTQDAVAHGWRVEPATGTATTRGIAFGAVARWVVPRPNARAPVTVDVLARLGDHLRTAAAAGPLLLVIDDVHLLDDATATLIQQSCVSGSLRALMAVRRGEPAPDAIGVLCKDRHVRRLELQPLSLPQVDELLSTIMEGTVDRPSRRLLWQACAGNVLMLRELLMMGVESGRLTSDDQVWHWTGQVAVSASIHDLVAARIDSLSAAEREGLELVAVGEPLPLPVVAACGHEQTVMMLERQGLITCLRTSTGVQVRIAHPLYGEAIREDLPTLAARRLRLILAGAMDTSGATGLDSALRIAVWLLDAGEVPATGMLLEAAYRAAALSDHALMERLARAAAEASGGFEAYLLLCRSLVWQARWAEADRLCRRSPLSRPETARQQSEITLTRAEILAWGLGRPLDALRLLAETTVSDSEELSRESAALAAAIAMLGGHDNEVAQAAVHLLSDSTVSPRATTRAMNCAILSLAGAGATSAAIDYAERSVAALASGTPAATGWHADLIVGRCAALRYAGRLEDAVGLTLAFRDEADTDLDDYSSALAAFALGQALLESGMVRRARDVLREAAELLRCRDPGGFLPWCLAYLASGCAVCGEVRRAAETLAESEAPGFHLAPVYIADMLRAQCWTAAARGELSAARAMAVRAAEQAAAVGHSSVEAAAWHDLVRLGDARAAVDRLGRLAGHVDGCLVQAYATHAAAEAKHDGPGLDLAAAQLARAGARLLAAEAAAGAAVAHAAAGHRAPAHAARLTANRLRAECDQVSTPALRRLGMTSQLLTPREDEIIGLAGRGLSNLQIAAALQVSVRTVEGHLQRAYAKLDLHRRSELPAS